jgi:reverse gyrase
MKMQAMRFLRKQPCPNCGGQITALNKAPKTVSFVNSNPVPLYVNLPCRRRVQTSSLSVAAASGVGKATVANISQIQALAL